MPAPDRVHRTHSTHTCPCGKQAYPTRRRARAHRRTHFPDDPNLKPYRCDRVEGATSWHLGHSRYHRDGTPKHQPRQDPT